MKNESGLSPLGHAVLVKPYEPEIKKSVIQIPETVKERTAMVEIRAVVVEVGPEAWRDEQLPRADVGDKVFLTRFAGILVKGTADGQTYRLVNDSDIYCKIVEEANNVR